MFLPGQYIRVSLRYSKVQPIRDPYPVPKQEVEQEVPKQEVDHENRVVTGV